MSRRKRLAAEAEREMRMLVAALPPELRPVAETAARVLRGPVLGRLLGRMNPVHRAGAYMGLKNAMEDLVRGKPCDVCGARATTFRPLWIPPERMPPGARERRPDIGALCYPLVCGACDRGRLDRIRDAVLRHLSPPDDGSPVGLCAALLGPRVGGFEGLRGFELQTCRDCGQGVWIRTAEREALEPHESRPLYLCFECAAPRLESGHLAAMMMPGGMP